MPCRTTAPNSAHSATPLSARLPACPPARLPGCPPAHLPAGAPEVLRDRRVKLWCPIPLPLALKCKNATQTRIMRGGNAPLTNHRGGKLPPVPPTCGAPACSRARVPTWPPARKPAREAGKGPECSFRRDAHRWTAFVIILTRSSSLLLKCHHCVYVISVP